MTEVLCVFLGVILGAMGTMFCFEKEIQRRVRKELLKELKPEIIDADYEEKP